MLLTTRDMISAEVLKLRRRRGLFWWSVVLLIVAPIVIYAMSEALAALGSLAAALIGTTAGAGDESAGVFRDLVSTGRSRLALFAVRIPGAALLLVPLLAIGFAVILAGCYGLAGDTATPSFGWAAQLGLWLLVACLLQLVMGVGLASLIRSRGIAIGVLLTWSLAIGPVLYSYSFFGAAREVVSVTAVDQLRPVTDGDQSMLPMSLAAAVTVIAAWALVFAAAGAWRTATQDA
jgi:hypothetical protein